MESSEELVIKQAMNEILSTPMLFFFITPVGLEDLAQSDVENILKKHNRPYEINLQTKGGFELSMLFVDLLDLIPHMKSLTRILMRLGSPTNPKLYQTIVRDYPKLFQKISKFHWEHFLFGELPTIEFSAKNSRIFDSRKVEKAIHDGILRHYQMKPVKAIYLNKKETTPTNTLFVRIVDDLLTVSIDLIGDRLDLRKEKNLTSQAPIRESIAYTLTKKLFSEIDTTNKLINLIDPFVGSGTFLKEAMELHSPTSTRMKNGDYAFFHFPLFDKWKKSPEFQNFKTRFTPSKENNKPSFLQSIHGFDIDPKMLDTAKQNIQNIAKEKDIPLFIDQLDATTFKLPKTIIQNANAINVILSNPPYGERIEIKNASGEKISKEVFLKMLLEKFKTENIHYVALVSTTEQTRTIKKDIIFRRCFLNGGLDVELIILKLF